MKCDDLQQIDDKCIKWSTEYWSGGSWTFNIYRIRCGIR